jgi:diguanylate cyclase (GGDEF)-like protein
MDDSRSRSPVAPSVLSAAAFFAAAGAFAALAPSTRSFGLVDVFLLVSFAVLVRLEYQVGAGAAVPAQLAFVPMLFLMPLRVVPLAVGGVCLLTSALATERTRAERSGESLSISLLDLDHFKRYNDSLGHPAGDDLLRRVANAWTSTLRAEALLARIGGEEFGLILPGATLEAAEAIVERLRGVTPREITFSAGLAAWDHEETIADLTERADVALYRAKREGRDRFVLAA